MPRLLIRNLMLVGALLGVLIGGAAMAAPLTLEKARVALDAPDPMDRFVGVERLADVGVPDDADRVLQRLADDDPRVRLAAGNAIWRIWGRSGDDAIDKLLGTGADQVRSGELEKALVTFDQVVQRDPAFAEGWNQRATVYYLLGRFDESLKDCEEVFRRNPRHFGALMGAGQIHLHQGRPDWALALFRRAVAINPNLDALVQVIPLLEKQIEARDRNRT